MGGLRRMSSFPSVGSSASCRWKGSQRCMITQSLFGQRVTFLLILWFFALIWKIWNLNRDLSFVLRGMV
jgi:hypothetical protein